MTQIACSLIVRQTMIATDSHSHYRTVYCQAVSLAVVHANHACMQHQACQLWLSTGCPQWSSQVPPLLLLLLLLLLLSLLLVLVLQLLVPTAAAAEGRLLRPTAPSCESTHPVGCPVPTHRAAGQELLNPALRCVKRNDELDQAACRCPHSRQQMAASTGEAGRDPKGPRQQPKQAHK